MTIIIELCGCIFHTFFVDTPWVFFYMVKLVPVETLAQSVEQLPFKQWVRSSILRRLSCPRRLGV